ncbi:TVP38/TMEM64 family protein [Hyphococcus flavus]|uniref:TVP38/TMEM64 family membrane protein n=1 Tax=Hyphococcus flavus TaxID=1866326 RepID=A0AAF0CB90_9PROT|nr:TVP38/TMEM64 family protein [Hyphococcus flavus]WDI30280.1 TVP38/TMEM64 family protein [Hyphococcus flavus]
MTGTSPKPSLTRRIAPLALIAAALALFFAMGLNQYFTLDSLRDNRDAMRGWVESAPLRAMVIFVLAYAAAVAISFPGASILTIFGGFLFGLWPGTPLIVIAATLGATIVFLAAKYALGDLLSKRAGGFAKRMEKGFREGELSYMFILRLAPVFPFWGVNIAAGLLGVSLRNFLIGTGLGIIPGSFVYASIGAGADKVLAAGGDLTLSGVLFKPATLIPIAGLIVLALIPVFLRRKKNELEE